jgi:hypothetical protein
MSDIIVTLAILWHLLANMAQEAGMPEARRSSAPRLSTAPAVSYGSARAPLTSAERNARHRGRHGDAYRAKRAAYMKAYRARQRAIALAA